MHRTIIAGSPRAQGRCAHLAQELFDACIEERPGDGVSLVSVSGISVGGCIGCDACKQELPADSDRAIALPEEGDPLRPQERICAGDSQRHVCPPHAADELIAVVPVYFAGAPSQMKALLDRLQPYYWSDAREGEKRPLTLHVVGEGGDPHGIEPLIGCVRSALSVAGFSLVEVLDWRGRIDADGTIREDAREYAV